MKKSEYHFVLSHSYIIEGSVNPSSYDLKIYLRMKQQKKMIELYNHLVLRDRFLEGDDEAYSQLYTMVAPELYAFGLSMQFKPTLIEDAIHDVFEEIYRRRDKLKQINNLKYYFIIAFRNRLFFLSKKEQSMSLTAESFDFLPNVAEKDRQDRWIEEEIILEKEQLVKKLMSELTVNQREAIYYRFIEGFSIEEIASLMNINHQSVKNLIHRSIKKMNALKMTPLYFDS